MKYFHPILVGILGTIVLFMYTTSNAAWTEQTTSGSRVWRSIASSSDGTKLAAVVYGGYIYTSTDSGGTWTAQTTAGSRNWRSVTSSSDGTKLAAAVFGGYIYTSTDSGATWTERLSSGARNWYSITSSTDGTKIAAGIEDGYIYTSTDSGGAWTTQTASGARYWYGIASSADGVKLAAAAFTYGGYISTSVNSGVAWSTNSNSSGSRAWNSIASSADGVKLAAVVGSGYVYTSTDSGVTWGTQSDSSGSRDWRSITSSSDGTKLAAVAYGGYIYTSTDSGASWTQETSAGSRNWQSISSASDGGKIAAAVDSGYIYTFISDVTAPTITNVSSDKVNGSYKAGEVIDIDVTFSEIVTSTGNVTVTLETGDTDRTCTFTVTSATTGTCNYTVQAGDNSADLTVASIAGTIVDGAAIAMVNFVPDTNLAANKAIVIDTAGPVISGISVVIRHPPGADISWTTDENATSYIEYGLSDAYGSNTTLDEDLVTAHSQTISSLAQVTTYHYRIISEDALGNSTTTADYVFTTSGATPGVRVKDEPVVVENKEEKTEEVAVAGAITPEETPTLSTETGEKEENEKTEPLSFTDISASFASTSIELFVARGIIQGYSDNTFLPDNPITRGEFLAITMKALDIAVVQLSESNFTDIPSDGPWMIPYIETARTLGIANGQTIDGVLKFRPNDSITRAEAIAILLNAANITLDASLKSTQFQDVPAGGWMIPYIETARTLGIANGQTIDGVLKFRPNDSITRAEAIQIIADVSAL